MAQTKRDERTTERKIKRVFQSHGNLSVLIVLSMSYIRHVFSPLVIIFFTLLPIATAPSSVIAEWFRPVGLFFFFPHVFKMYIIIAFFPLSVHFPVVCSQRPLWRDTKCQHQHSRDLDSRLKPRILTSHYSFEHNLSQQ